jgi:hypothetical protein
MGDGLCLRRPAPSGVRHDFARLSATRSVMAPTMTRRRVGKPCVLSPPPLSLRLRQNTRPYAFAGVVAHHSATLRFLCSFSEAKAAALGQVILDS